MEKPANVGSRSTASRLCIQLAELIESTASELDWNAYSFFFPCRLATSTSAPPFHAVSDFINSISVVVDALLPCLPIIHTVQQSEQGMASQIKAAFSDFSGIGAMLVVFMFFSVYLSILYLDCDCLLGVGGSPVGLQKIEELSPVFSDTRDSQHELMDKWDTVRWLP